MIKRILTLMSALAITSLAFAKEYNVHYLNKSYHDWNNASKNKSDKTVEVYICNYEIT